MRKTTRCAYLITTASLTVMVPAFTLAADYTYGLEAMVSYSACDTECDHFNTIHYADDAMAMLAVYLSGRTSSPTFSLSFYYEDEDVWASDTVEDRDYYGEDSKYADNVDFYAATMHGEAPSIPGQRYYGRFCRAGAILYGGTCTWRSQDVRWGEQYGYSYWAWPNPGKMRSALLFSCYSVHDHPDQQWQWAFLYGPEYLLGFKGNVAIGWTTAETPRDFATGAFKWPPMTFRAAWFDAVEDWYHCNTGGIFTAGFSAYDATYRRENYNYTWGRREDDGVDVWFAWAHHYGGTGCQ